MAAVSGAFAAFNAKVYYSSSEISDKTEANLEAAIIDANLVEGIQEISEITAEGNNIEYGEYGQAFSSNIPGQKTPGTFDMSITMDFSDSIHTGFRDDDGKTTRTFIVVFEESDSNKTYAAFDGRILSSSVALGIDSVTMLNVSISRMGGATWVDNS